MKEFWVKVISFLSLMLFSESIFYQTNYLQAIASNAEYTHHHGYINFQEPAGGNYTIFLNLNKGEKVFTIIQE